MELNPELVQAEFRARPRFSTGAKLPVFLIHDGGGTTYPYHCLESLHRHVYGIFNPKFFTSEAFEGGLPEMGRLYAGYIKDAVSQENFPAKKDRDGTFHILLGGWSLGGMLSLEIARVLAEDDLITVKGLVMIDSVYTIPPAEAPPNGYAPADSSEEGKSKNEILSQRAMTQARNMITTWELPTWDGPLEGKRPKAALLRAKDHFPVQEAYKDRISGIDVYRKDPRLGWDAYDEKLFTSVTDIGGHHYDLFYASRIKETSDALRNALNALQREAYA